jgi:AAA+ ATPase superfamily predicted ATPase
MDEKITSNIIARDTEQKLLKDLLESETAEFLAIYGRRRIGKTFLIREFFKARPVVFFNPTGSKDAPLGEQIGHFTKIIGDIFYNAAPLNAAKDWDGTFELLTKAMNNSDKTKKIVLFLDEFPWMATARSRLLENLDYYWNQYWSQDNRIKLVICGSSASWIINKIVNNKGGLHNRITKRILLKPFNLLDTKNLLLSRGIKLNNNQILQIYMLTGGVPYYLSNIRGGLSASQNIENLAFTKDGILAKEFDNLFSSLFDNFELHINIIKAIAKYRYGLGQERLFEEIGKHFKGKQGINSLKELEDAGFIMSFKPFTHKQKGIYYKVIDEYTLFYLKWLEPVKDVLFRSDNLQGYWEKQQNSQSWHSWAGLSFESVCYKHSRQIIGALALTAAVLPYSWRYVTKNKEEVGAQIDLLFDRSDDAITLCEIKYTNTPFVVDKSYAESLERKKEVFIKRTKTEKHVFYAMISANGVKPNEYTKKLLDNVVTLDALFKP